DPVRLGSLSGESGGIWAKGQSLNQFTPEASPSQLFLKHCQKKSQIRRRIGAGRPGEDQFFQFSVIILKIDPGGKGPHTVSQHIDRNSRKMFFNPTGHLMKIFYNPLIPSSIKISQVL